MGGWVGGSSSCLIARWVGGWLVGWVGGWVIGFLTVPYRVRLGGRVGGWVVRLGREKVLCFVVWGEEEEEKGWVVEEKRP